VPERGRHPAPGRHVGLRAGQRGPDCDARRAGLAADQGGHLPGPAGQVRRGAQKHAHAGPHALPGGQSGHRGQARRPVGPAAAHRPPAAGDGAPRAQVPRRQGRDG